MGAPLIIYPIYEMGLITVLVTALGFCLGSFATALIHRLPRGISMARDEGRSYGASRSACPQCHHTLGILDLIPFFSWVFLRGRCRYCQGKIGLAYPLTELGTALLCLLFYACFGFGAELWILMALAPVLMAIVVIDLQFRIIPDVLNLAVFALGLGFLAFSGGLIDGLVAAVVYGAFLYILRFIFMRLMKRDPVGLGDVKFFFGAGIWLGLPVFPYFLMISGVAGMVLAVIWRFTTGEKEFPFGPALVTALVLLLCFDILSWL